MTEELGFHVHVYILCDSENDDFISKNLRSSASYRENLGFRCTCKVNFAGR